MFRENESARICGQSTWQGELCRTGVLELCRGIPLSLCLNASLHMCRANAYKAGPELFRTLTRELLDKCFPEFT